MQSEICKILNSDAMTQKEKTDLNKSKWKKFDIELQSH